MQLDSTRIAIVQTTDDCPGSLLVLMLLALLKDEDEDEVEMRWRWMNTAPVPEYTHLDHFPAYVTLPFTPPFPILSFWASIAFLFASLL